MELLERSEQLDDLDQALGEARSGHSRVAVISGEAGIGKTSLTRLFIEHCSVVPLLGACDDVSVPTVLGPFRDILATSGLDIDFNDMDRVRGATLDAMAGCDVAVVEDIHWAGEATLDLLTHIINRIDDLAVLLVLTTRPTDRHDVARCLAQIPTEAFVAIDLPPLTLDAVRRVVGAEAEEIHRVTGGNPFLVDEVLRTPGSAVPARVTTSTLARLGDLSPPAHDVARMLAVLPSGLPWSAAVRLGPDAHDSLDELERHGWLDAGASRIAFRHELVRMAIDESLTEVARRRLNALVLEQVLDESADPAAIAHHAFSAGDDQTAVDYAIMAARQLASAGAHRDALAQLERAADLDHLLPDEERAEFMTAIGYEMLVANRPEDSRDALVRAAERWGRLGASDRQANALSAASAASWRLGRQDESIALLDQALACLGPEHVLEHFRVLVIRAQSVGFTSRWKEAKQQVDEALRHPPDVGSKVLALAYGVRADANRLLGDADAAAADYEQSMALSREAGDLATLLATSINRIATSLASLDLTGIDERLESANDLAESLQAMTQLVSLQELGAGVAFERGHWSEALERAAAVERQTSATRIRQRYVTAMIHLRRGDERGPELLDQAWEAARGQGDIQRLGHVGVGYAEAQWLGEAEEPTVVMQIARLAERSGHVTFSAELALWCRRLGLDGPPPPAHGHPALLLEASGDGLAAARAWEKADLPYRRLLALGFTESDEAIREAIDGATALGAVRTADRLRARLRELGHRVHRGSSRDTLANPGGLTARQMDVLRLVAEGCTNREIAERLYISPKTAGHHVSAVLTQLGVSDRREAAEWAVQAGVAGSKDGDALPMID